MAVDSHIVYSYSVEKELGNFALVGWRIMDRLLFHVTAAVVAQRTKDWPFLRILLVSRFPAPGVGYPTAHFRAVSSTNSQGCGSQQTFVVFYQGGVDLDGDPHLFDSLN